MIITPSSEDIFRLPFSLKEKRENDELLSDYSRSVAVNNSEDTVHFSETSLTKLQESSTANKEPQDQKTIFLYNKNGERVHTNVVAEAGDQVLSDANIPADEQTIQSIRKQIKEVEKKIDKTQTQLSEAMSDLQNKKSGIELEAPPTSQPTPPLSVLKAVDEVAQPIAKEKNPESSAVAEEGAPESTATPSTSEEAQKANGQNPEAALPDTAGMDEATKAMINAAIAQTEVDMLASELKNLNAQLLNLNNKLAEAIKGKMGGFSGPPGAAGGTPAMGVL